MRVGVNTRSFIAFLIDFLLNCFTAIIDLSEFFKEPELTHLRSFYAKQLFYFKFLKKNSAMPYFEFLIMEVLTLHMNENNKINHLGHLINLNPGLIIYIKLYCAIEQTFVMKNKTV